MSRCFDCGDLTALYINQMPICLRCCDRRAKAVAEDRQASQPAQKVPTRKVEVLKQRKVAA